METGKGLLSLEPEALRQVVEQYPWCSTARLLLWNGTGELPVELRLRQSFHRLPDYLRQQVETGQKPQVPPPTLPDVIDRFWRLHPLESIPKRILAPEKISRPIP